MRQVALKTARASTHEAAARLTQEALITAHLDHPNIVPLFDAGITDDGDVFYTMRLVRGRSLEAALAESDDLKARLSFVRHYLATCQAMAYAHGAGVVHRDLKPDNVMIGDFGETQIVDWGVAKPLASEQGNAWRREVLPDDVVAETQCHEIIGTPSYMAPEQATPNAGPTIAADVFGLGAILYRLLTGHPPFRGAATTAELLALVRRNAFKALSSADSEGYPPELVAICERAMQSDAAQRYTSAAALAEDVAAWLDGRRVDAYAYSAWESLKRVARQWRVPLTIGGIATVVLALVATFAAAEIVHERDAARAAEDKAATNEALAEARLAEALIGQAKLHLAEGRDAEAELAAATAATFGARPDPRAMGILMATVDTYGPSALTRADLPIPCPGPTLSPSGGRLVCSDAKHLTMYELREGRFVALWEKAFSHSQVTFGPIEGGPNPVEFITAVNEFRMPLLFRADSGDPTHLPGRPKTDPHVHAGARTASPVASGGASSPVVFFAGLEVAVLNARGLVVPGRICEQSYVETAAIRGDKLAAICGDGVLMKAEITADGELTKVESYKVDFQEPTGDIGEFGPGYVATLRRDGMVATITPRGRLQMRGGATPRWLDTDIPGATALAFSPDGNILAIQSLTLGVHLLSVDPNDFGRPIAKLPRRFGRALAWTSDGLTTVGDDSAVTWSLPASGPRHVYGRTTGRGSDGLATLDVQGDRLVFGGGDGRVGVCSVQHGLCAEERPHKNVIKRIRLYNGGNSFRACCSALFGIIEGNIETGARYISSDSRPLRRLEPFADGRWVGASWDRSPGLVVGDGAPSPPWPETDTASDLDVFAGRDTAFLTENTWSLVLVEGDQEPQTIAHVPGARAVALNAELVAVAFEAELVLMSRTGKERARWSLGALTPTDLDWFENNLIVGHKDGSIQVWRAGVDGRHELVASMPTDGVGHQGRVGEVMARDDALWSAGWDGVVRRWSRAPLNVPASELLARARARWALKETIR